MKKNHLRSVVVALICVGAISVAVAESQAAKNAPLLFVQMAKGALLTPDAKNPNAYTLALTNVNPKTLWFNDRPGRAAGSTSMTEFLKLWSVGKDSFKLDHPNAAVVSMAMEDGSEGQVVAPVFTISQPNYNASTQTLTYQAVLVKGGDKPLQLSMADVAVMVDGSGSSGCVVKRGCHGDW